MVNNVERLVESERAQSMYAPGTTNTGKYAGPLHSGSHSGASYGTPGTAMTGAGAGSGNGTGFGSGAASRSGSSSIASGAGMSGTGAGAGTGFGAEDKVHNSNLLNKLDPRVDSVTGVRKGSTASGMDSTGAGPGQPNAL